MEQAGDVNCKNNAGDDSVPSVVCREEDTEIVKSVCMTTAISAKYTIPGKCYSNLVQGGQSRGGQSKQVKHLSTAQSEDIYHGQVHICTKQTYALTAEVEQGSNKLKSVPITGDFGYRAC